MAACAAAGSEGTGLQGMSPTRGVQRGRVAGVLLVPGVQLLSQQGCSQCTAVMESSPGVSTEGSHEPALQGIIHWGLQHMRVVFQSLWSGSDWNLWPASERL